MEIRISGTLALVFTKKKSFFSYYKSKTKYLALMEATSFLIILGWKTFEGFQPKIIKKDTADSRTVRY